MKSDPLQTPLLPLCEHAISLARAAGADEAEAFAERARSVKARAEQNDLVGADADESMALGLRVLVKGAVGFFALNRVDDASLEHAARTAVALAKAGTPEDGPRLPDPTTLTPVAGLVDEAVMNAPVPDAVERCHALLMAMKDADARIRVDGCEVDFSVERHAIASTRGVKAEELQTSASQSAFGFAADGDDVSSFDAEMSASVRLNGLSGPAMGKLLAENLLKLLGADNYDGPSDGDVILGPDAFEEVLIAPLLESLDGDAVRTGRSRLAELLGKSAASELLTIIDDPLVAGEVGCESFDREGLGHVRMALVEKGVVRSFLHNSDSARRLKQSPTGHATGSARSLPSIGITRMVIEPGQVGLADLIGGVKDGLYVGRFSGSVDEVSGDFSGVAKCGFRIRNGKLAEPVKETLIAGNAFDVLKAMRALSRDRKVYPGSLVPWALCNSISISSAE